MTRKDYILIAKAITDTQERIKADCSYADTDAHKRDTDQQLRGVRRVAAHLATALTLDNPRGFDPTRFLKACGYGASDFRDSADAMPENERHLGDAYLSRPLD